MAAGGEAPTQGAGVRVLLTAAALVVVVAGLKAVESIFVPVLFAAFIAVISAPAMFWLQRKRVPAGLSVTLVVLAVVGFIALVGTLVGTSVTDFTNAMPRYRERLLDIVASTTQWAAGYGVEIDTTDLLSQIDPGQAMGWVGGALTSLASTLSDTVFVILTMVFILLEAAAMPRKLRAAMDNPEADLSKFARVADEINKYLVIKTLVSLATGVLAGFGVWALGVDFPFLWGLVAFLLNFIPNLGSIIAAVPPVLLALIQFGGWRALAVTAVYVVINTVMGNVVEPHFMGKRLGLSSLVVFLSLVVWGWLWGPVGMLLSVPLTMIVKIMLENSDDFRWVSVFLGPDLPDPTPPNPRSPTGALRRILQDRRESAVWGEADTPGEGGGATRRPGGQAPVEPSAAGASVEVMAQLPEARAEARAEAEAEPAVAGETGQEAPPSEGGQNETGPVST